MSEKHRKLITSNCIDCRKEIFHRKNTIRNRCQSCDRAFRTLTAERIQLECTYCHKPFIKKTSRLTGKHNVYFCSRKCKDTAQSLNGGCKEIQPAHYGASNGKHLVEGLTIKIGKCISCSENRLYLLQVHHIDGNRENNIEENFEVVCSNCHIKRHLKFENGVWLYDTKCLTPREKLLEV